MRSLKKMIKSDPLKLKSFSRTFIVLMFLLSWNQNAIAHCDRENGPVAVAAKEALKTGNFDQILIWVGKDQEEELREKFQQSLGVYRNGGNPADLAQRYFMETAVRLHRAAEGMPFTGLKTASPNPPDIEAAEKALETGNLEPFKELLCQALQDESYKWLQEARESKENKDENIAAGREWVNNYVKYITYIHKLYQTILAGPPHGVDSH